MSQNSELNSDKASSPQLGPQRDPLLFSPSPLSKKESKSNSPLLKPVNSNNLSGKDQLEKVDR